jgi:hypothetical protein
MNLLRACGVVASIAIASLLSACGGGSDAPPTTPTPTPTVNATVSGIVRSAAGAAMAGVHVTLGSSTADTDANGQYQFTLPNTTTDNVLRFSKTGYASQVRRTEALSTRSLQAVNATLSQVTASPVFSPSSANTLTVTGSTAQVTLAANALVRAGGAAATGPATAQLTVIDPSELTGVMPGNYQTGTAAAPQLIESNGALQVEFTDADGSKLQLAAGQTATIRIPAVSRGGAALPTTIPLFYLDETTALWVQEGSATLQGTAPAQYYEGTVTHFTVWNGDRVIDTVFINGCLQESTGTRVGAGALVLGEGVDYIGFTTAYTDATGAFRIPVRKSSITKLLGQSLSPFRFGPAVAVTVGTTDVTMTGCLTLDSDGYSPPLAFPPTPVTPSPTPVGAYAGHYTGTYAGKESGTFDVTISASGVVTGSVHSITYSMDFSVNGAVAAGGALSLDAAAGTAGASAFSGTINSSTGAVVGSWRYLSTAPPSTDGTFSGTRG